MKIRYLFGFVLALWATALSAQAHWSFDYHQYRYDMTVYFELKESGRVVKDVENYEVAAFVGDECRGIASFETQTGSNGTTLKYGFLKVYSNMADGETVTFLLYNKTTGEETVIEDTSIPFVTSSAVGYPSEPLTLRFGPPYTAGDVNGDGKISAIDVTLCIRYILEGTTTGFIIEAADMNDDGNVSAIDVTLIIQTILNM